MKNHYLAILLFTIVSCNAQTKETISEYSCACINQLSNELTQTELIEQIRKCVSEGVEKYPEEMQKIMIDFNPENTIPNYNSEQLHFSKILSEKLIKECPKYSKITSSVISNLFPAQSEILEIVADDICLQLNKIKDQKLSNAVVDPIVIKTVMKYEDQVAKEYNLYDKEQMGKLGTELAYKLMDVCESYKVFGIQTIH